MNIYRTISEGYLYQCEWVWEKEFDQLVIGIKVETLRVFNLVWGIFVPLVLCDPDREQIIHELLSQLLVAEKTGKLWPPQ